jgi:AcrR family transcriptional regulator
MKTKRPYVMTARAARTEATRTRIRTAAMELYCTGAIEDFTLDAVAARAETTVQTVLRAFGSKDQLIYAALAELAAVGLSLRPTPPGDVAAAVAAIFDVYETMGDLVIQRLADEHRRPALKPSLDEGRDNHRDWVRTVFAPYLGGRKGGAQETLLAALRLATDVYSWKLLRRDHGLPRPAAEAVVRTLVAGAMERKNGDEPDSVVELVGRRQSAP